MKISKKVFPEGPIDNKAALVQVVAWCLFSANNYTNDDTA